MHEAKGEQAAQLIGHLRKPEMAKEAERLLAGTGWLPEPLRTPGWRLVRPRHQGISSGACSRMTANVSCSPRLESRSIHSNGIAPKSVG